MKNIRAGISRTNVQTVLNEIIVNYGDSVAQFIWGCARACSIVSVGSTLTPKGFHTLIGPELTSLKNEISFFLVISDWGVCDATTEHLRKAVSTMESFTGIPGAHKRREGNCLLSRRAAT